MPSESIAETTIWSVTFRLTPNDVRTARRIYLKGRYRRGPIYAAIAFTALGAGVGWLAGVAADRSRLLATTVGAGLTFLLLWALTRSAERNAIRQSELAGLFHDAAFRIMPTEALMIWFFKLSPSPFNAPLVRITRHIPDTA